MPSESQYDGYPQIENGVGMITSFTNEFEEELEFIDEVDDSREVSVATGYAAYDCIKKLCEETEKKFSNVKVHVYRIKNNFFGGHVTVAGLVTGKDLTEQLKGQPLGEELLIPSVMLRHEGDLFLCGMSLTEAEDILGIKIKTNGPNGADLLHAIIGM
jgi:NifB/MoaA-like Fe-S oxidoreductase